MTNDFYRRKEFYRQKYRNLRSNKKLGYPDEEMVNFKTTKLIDRHIRSHIMNCEQFGLPREFGLLEMSFMSFTLLDKDTLMGIDFEGDTKINFN